MIRKKIIISLLLFSIQCTTPSCGTIKQFTEQDIWNFFKFSNFEVYFTIIIGAISILLLTLALLSYKWRPSLSTPFDILLIMISSLLLDNVSLYAEVVYFIAHQSKHPPSGFKTTCSAAGFTNMFGSTIALYYNTFFCAALGYSIANTLRKPFLDRIKLHILAFVTAISAVFVVIYTQNAGAPLKGICIYRSASQSSLGLFFLHIIVFVAVLYAIRKFRAQIPKNSYFQQKSHFRYYHSYMIFFAVCEAAIVILYLIGNISCRANGEQQQLLNELFAGANVVTVLQGLGCALLRLTHPSLRRLYRVWANRNDPVDEQERWMDTLVQSIKGSQILSFTQAILMSYVQHSSRYPRKLTPYHFQRQYRFYIDESIAEDYLRRRVTNRDSHFRRQNSAGLKTLQYEATVSNPQYYSWLFRVQGINLFPSFDIRKNLSLVKQQSYTQGGKSGQFFFGTHDNKFIFKTVSSEQAEVCSTRAQQFHDHFLKHPKSLLVKILGLYKFKRRDITAEPVNLILMRNLTQSSKDGNIRVYDIKGSQFNRSTLRERRINKDQQEKLRKFTLKDKDFLEVQGKIIVQGKQQLLQVLIEDIKFLGGLGVMDYSLLIIKRQGVATKAAGEYPSSQEPETFFHFGIIDYLEQWTLRRKAERVFKTLITSEEVTANSPLNYSQRLIDFLQQVL